jgi:CO dehydrogenase/acetyl-CoA synthase epsilon subunit
MASNLKVLETEADKYKADAKAMLLEQAEAGYDRVIVMGFKNDTVLYKCSSTPNFLEDIGAMTVAIIGRYIENTKENE